MAQALLAVTGDLGLVGIRAAGRHHVAVHVVEAVLEPARLLDRRPPAQVDDALGQRGGPPGPAGPLGDEHLGPGLGGGERRRRPGRAEAHDDHVGRVVPARDLRCSHGVTSFGSRTSSSLRCRRDGSRCHRRAPSPTLRVTAAPAPDRAGRRPNSTARTGLDGPLAYRLVPDLTTWRLTGPDGVVRFAKVDTAAAATPPCAASPSA